MRHRRISPDHEIELGQLPPVLDTGRDETSKSQGRGGHHLRTHPAGWQHLLRQQGGERPRHLQGTEPSHHRQPL